MLKKFLLSVAVLLIFSEVCTAGNLDGAKFLAGKGFRLIENENLFIIKNRNDIFHPFLKIECLPAHFDITDEVKNECLKKLVELRKMLAKCGKDSNKLDNFFSRMENSLVTQKQRAYKFDIDVNYDGVADAYICPGYEFLKFTEDWKSYGYRKFYSVLDNSIPVKIPIKQKYVLEIGDSPLMPLFAETEYNVYDCYKAPEKSVRSSLTLETYPRVREALFVPTKVRLYSNEDGNLKVILADEKNKIDGQPQEVSFQTNFKWEE
ncbi:MAG: hypothetical protein QMC67_17420 [Candidatus Wallbacteria bacterium]